MDSIFLHLQNFTAISYVAFAIVLMSFFLEAKSNSPYKSLLLSNAGFGVYNFSLLTCSEIDFPIYFILLSFLICSWFFVLKNIEEEEDEDRGFLRNYHNDSIVGFNEIENNKKNSSIADSALFNFKDFLIKESSKLFESKLMLFIIFFFKNDPIHYEHPQRKFVNALTYVILISILVSFFLV
jgi:succinate dehydrogenase hydrophobic anchor subunit